MSDLLKSGRSPNYQTTTIQYFGPPGDQKELPIGSFVRPVSLEYVPKHIINHKDNQYFNKEKHTFFYCSFGFSYALKNSIIEV